MRHKGLFPIRVDHDSAIRCHCRLLRLIRVNHRDPPASLERHHVWSDDLGSAPECAEGGALIWNTRQIRFEEESRLSPPSEAWRFRPSSIVTNGGYIWRECRRFT